MSKEKNKELEGERGGEEGSTREKRGGGEMVQKALSDATLILAPTLGSREEGTLREGTVATPESKSLSNFHVSMYGWVY